jgi:hypothetical protein
MTNSGFLRRSRVALFAECSLEGRMQIKRTVSRIQARIHAAELIENAAEFAAWACRKWRHNRRRARAIGTTKSP